MAVVGDDDRRPGNVFTCRYYRGHLAMQVELGGRTAFVFIKPDATGAPGKLSTLVKDGTGVRAVTEADLEMTSGTDRAV